MALHALIHSIPGWALELHRHSLDQVVELRCDADLLDDQCQDLGQQVQKSWHC